MTKYCFVGDSHLAALRMGWKDFEDTSADFFPLRLPGGSHLERDGKFVVPSTEYARHRLQKLAGTDRFAPGDYDAVFVVGLNIGLGDPIETAVNHRLLRWPRDEAQLLSEAGLGATFKDSILQSHAMKVVSAIRRFCEVPIRLVPHPNPGRLLLERSRYSWLSRDEDASLIFSDLLELYVSQLMPIMQRYKCHFFPQPRSTLDEAQWTSAEFVRDVSDREGEPDAWHMNKEYGITVIQEMLP